VKWRNWKKIANDVPVHIRISVGVVSFLGKFSWREREKMGIFIFLQHQVLMNFQGYGIT